MLWWQVEGINGGGPKKAKEKQRGNTQINKQKKNAFFWDKNRFFFYTKKNKERKAKKKEKEGLGPSKATSPDP